MIKKLLLTIIALSLLGCASKEDEIKRFCNFVNDSDIQNATPDRRMPMLARKTTKFRSPEVLAALNSEESGKELAKLADEAGIKPCHTLEALKPLKPLDRAIRESAE